MFDCRRQRERREGEKRQRRDADNLLHLYRDLFVFVSLKRPGGDVTFWRCIFDSVANEITKISTALIMYKKQDSIIQHNVKSFNRHRLSFHFLFKYYDFRYSFGSFDSRL